MFIMLAEGSFNATPASSDDLIQAAAVRWLALGTNSSYCKAHTQHREERSSAIFLWGETNSVFSKTLHLKKCNGFGYRKNGGQSNTFAVSKSSTIFTKLFFKAMLRNWNDKSLLYCTLAGVIRAETGSALKKQCGTATIKNDSENS
jgi:hypothetical protein